MRFGFVVLLAVKRGGTSVAPMDGLAHSLAVASCGLEATEIAELSAMYDLYAVKRTDHVITEAEARGLWRLLGVMVPEPMQESKSGHLVTRNLFLVRSGDYLQGARVDPHHEEAAIFQMLDPPCKGYCTNGHLRKFIESTGLEVQETEVNILTERISSTGDHDGFDRNDFVKYMAATREARDTAFDSDEEGEKT